MKQVLIDVPISEGALRRLEALPGVSVRVVPPRKSRDEWPADLIRDCQVLLCRFPPSNFEDLKALEFLQLSSVGYEHLRDLGLADRPVRVCNARGLFDSAIAEWNLAMMV